MNGREIAEAEAYEGIMAVVKCDHHLTDFSGRQGQPRVEVAYLNYAVVRDVPTVFSLAFKTQIPHSAVP